MASMRDIKRRKSGIQSTQQITKAMKLVSTVKLQHAKAAAERSKSYFRCMYETVNNILSRVAYMEHPYLTAGVSGKKAVIVITSNRGFAGGYNSNVVKLVTAKLQAEEMAVYAIGNKGRDALQRRGYEIRKDRSKIIEAPTYVDAMKLSSELLEAFSEGEISEIYLAYTSFKNTVTHLPTLLKLLPVKAGEQSTTGSENEHTTESGISVDENTSSMDASSEEELVKNKALMNFEPEDEEALNMIIPKYISSLIYGALMESSASENGARMQAMDSATKNAEEMIEDLTLMYNRARQGSITQELIEIISGAEAIS